MGKSPFLSFCMIVYNNTKDFKNVKSFLTGGQWPLTIRTGWSVIVTPELSPVTFLRQIDKLVFDGRPVAAHNSHGVIGNRYPELSPVTFLQHVVGCCGAEAPKAPEV